MIDFFPLDNRLREPIQTKIHQEQTECRHHYDQAEVPWGQEAGQNSGSNNLDRKSETTGEDCDRGAAKRVRGGMAA